MAAAGSAAAGDDAGVGPNHPDPPLFNPCGLLLCERASPSPAIDSATGEQIGDFRYERPAAVGAALRRLSLDTRGALYGRLFRVLAFPLTCHQKGTTRPIQGGSIWSGADV